MVSPVYLVYRICYHPSGKQELPVGFAHYEFDVPRIIQNLKAETPGEYGCRPLPCLSVA